MCPLQHSELRGPTGAGDTEAIVQDIAFPTAIVMCVIVVAVMTAISAEAVVALV